MTSQHLLHALSGLSLAWPCRDPKPKDVPQAGTWLAAYLQAFQDALEAPDWLRLDGSPARDGLKPSGQTRESWVAAQPLQERQRVHAANVT